MGGEGGGEVGGEGSQPGLKRNLHSPVLISPPVDASLPTATSIMVEVGVAYSRQVNNN